MSKMSREKCLNEYLSLNSEEVACIKAITPQDAYPWYDFYDRNKHFSSRKSSHTIKFTLSVALICVMLAFYCTHITKFHIFPRNDEALEQKINSIISRKIEEKIILYDADKVGFYDYGALYAGGSIESYPETHPYPTNRSMFLFNYFALDEYSKPENILQSSNIPGDCFAFYGDKATIIVKLAKEIQIDSVTLEHFSLGLRTDPRSAPKTFEVYGLRTGNDNNGMFLGKFHYNILGKPWQTFQTEPINDKFQFIKLKILSNHGNMDYTCLYRFRVHSFN